MARKPLRERIILAALNTLRKNDPHIIIGVSDNEVRILICDEHTSNLISDIN